MVRSFCRNGRKHYATGSPRERHDHRRRQDCTSAIHQRPGSEAQPCSKVTTFAEYLGRLRVCGHGRSDQRPDSCNRRQPPNRFVFAGTTSDLSMEFGDPFFGLTEDNHKHTQPWPHHFGLAWVSGHDQSDEPPGFTTPSGTISSNSAMCLCPRSALIACVRCRTRSSRTRKPAATAWLSSQVTATKRIVGRLAASQIAAASALSVGEKTIHRIAFPFRLTLALDHRLHTGWQDPWYLVPELCNYPATEMSSATGFHRGKAARFLTEILQRPRSRHRCKQITAYPASSPP